MYERVIIDILRRWYDGVFRQQEPQILPVLARDAEAKRALQASMSAQQLIEAATGWEYVPEPGIRRVVLIPSSVLRPWSTSVILSPTKALPRIATHLQRGWCVS